MPNACLNSQVKGLIDLRDQEQIGEDFMFFKRFQAPRRWTVEEARTMLSKHKAGELSIGQMLQPTTERNTSAETIKVRQMLHYLCCKMYLVNIDAI